MEQELITHCAPTLASLKTASLFNLRYSCEKQLACQLAAWNARFRGKGVELMLLRKTKTRALIYVFRRTHLQQDLLQPGVEPFLKSCGYAGTDADGALQTLCGRLQETRQFPHEIGLFLGYPLCDVYGFICNKGRGCKCVGCWKVYGDEQAAARLFAKYEKCRAVYGRLWREGRSVLQLTVSAQGLPPQKHATSLRGYIKRTERIEI